MDNLEGSELRQETLHQQTGYPKGPLWSLANGTCLHQQGLMEPQIQNFSQYISTISGYNKYFNTCYKFLNSIQIMYKNQSLYLSTIAYINHSIYKIQAGPI